MRGKHGATSQHNHSTRTIPASAGETIPCNSARYWSGDYPRECGGNVDTIYLDEYDKGLSPRVRGKPINCNARTSSTGTIPASAGETQHCNLDVGVDSDYPRECGGNVPFASVWRPLLGLSPRVRGKHLPTCPGTLGHGTIPASAGETYRALRARLARRDYPRECGGNPSVINHAAAYEGLSPRVRGKRNWRLPAIRWRGTIPASAGETLPFFAKIFAIWDYPRECGGNLPTVNGGGGMRGLSPRVRGKQVFDGALCWCSGTIPASAGETQHILQNPHFLRDYPRECGGNLTWTRMHQRRKGLSPRVRGKL